MRRGFGVLLIVCFACSRTGIDGIAVADPPATRATDGGAGTRGSGGAPGGRGSLGSGGKRFGLGGSDGSGGATGTGDTDSGTVASDGGTSAPDAAGTPLAPFRIAECIEGSLRASIESLSDDGAEFAFVDEVGVVNLLDRPTAGRTEVAISLVGDEFDPPVIDGDGGRLAYGALPGNTKRVYVWDEATRRAPTSYLVGDSVDAALSGDGQFLAFSTRDQTLTDPPPNIQGGVVVADLSSGAIWQASVTTDGIPSSEYSLSPDISDDGRLTVFQSPSSNLVPGKPSRRWDLYLHDHATGETTLAARSRNGGYPADYSVHARISGDGGTVVFRSLADDIVAGDTADTMDVFVLDVTTGTTTSPTVGLPAGSTVEIVNVSRDGRFLLFESNADGLVPDDENGLADAFVVDRVRGTLESVTRTRDGLPLVDGGRPLAFSHDGRVVAFRTTSPELAAAAGSARTCFAVRAK